MSCLKRGKARPHGGSLWQSSVSAASAASASGAASDGQVNDTGATASRVTVRIRSGNCRASSSAILEPYDVPMRFTRS